MSDRTDPTLISQLGRSLEQRPGLFILRTFGTLAILGALFFWGGAWTPDFVFIILFLLFALYGQARDYALRLGPMVLLLIGPVILLGFSYSALRPLVPYLTPHVHYWPMIRFDRWLGHGTIPTVWLQNHLYHGHLSWYDYYFYALYNCHFLTPFVAAIIIWKRAPQHYGRYLAAFLTLSYASFITYIIFPAAPPWMSAQMGLVPPVHQIISNVWFALGAPDFPSLLAKLNPNEVAAVPSLHAAYPTLVLMFLGRSFGWRGIVAFAWYPVSLWIGIVYMGEHYVFDTLLGITYAVVTYLLVNWLFDRYAARLRHLVIRWHRRVEVAPAH